MKKFPPSISTKHSDYNELSRLQRAIHASAGGRRKLEAAMPQLIQEAIDFVIDPVRTARNPVRIFTPRPATYPALASRLQTV
jgi:hypothetical protein